jgi:repressor LexA
MRAVQREFREADEDLTERQRDILSFIYEHVIGRGYPPSVREIGEAVGLSSPSSVHSHLRTLQERGYLRSDPTKPRTIELFWDPQSGAQTERQPVRNVPLVGRIAAGAPILAAEQVDAVFPLPTELVGEGTVFMLRIKGDSMIGAGILDGDYVVVRQQPTARDGEIVAALIEGEEATVKRFFRRDGMVVLKPENPALKPLELREGVEIIGPVVSVLRRL